MSTTEPIKKTNNVYYIIAAVLALAVVLWIVSRRSQISSDGGESGNSNGSESDSKSGDSGSEGDTD